MPLPLRTLLANCEIVRADVSAEITMLKMVCKSCKRETYIKLPIDVDRLITNVCEPHEGNCS